MIHPGERQLFVDDLLIESMPNVTRSWHQGTKQLGKPILWPDEDGEELALLFGTVLFDEEDELFKMWYYSGRRASDGVWLGPMLAYATSKDGICWNKPELGLYEIGGSSANNVCYYAPGEFVEPAGVIKNPRPAGPEDKWVMCTVSRKAVKSYSILTSPDGLHWSEIHHWVPKEPVVKPDRACLVWDPLREEYALYCRARHHPDAPEQWFGDNWWGRAVALTKSKDLRSWSDPVLVMAPDSQDPPATEIYSLMAWPYGHMWLGLPQTYYSKSDQAFVNVQTAYSRDGLNWTRQRSRPFEAPFLPLGAVGEWDRFNQAVATCPLQVGEELYIYYSGRTYRHLGYRGADSGSSWGAIGLVRLRLDGWCSLDGSYDGACVISKPLQLPAGDLHLNAKADFGSVVIEVLEEAGDVVPGLTSMPIEQDAVDAKVVFADARTLADLPRQPLRLRFKLTNARLYSFWIE